MYIIRFGSGTDDKVSKVDGLDEEFLPSSESDEFPDPAPVKCPNCSRWTPSHDDRCIWCSITFNPEAAREPDYRTVESPAKDKARRDFLEMITNGEVDTDNNESARQLAHIISRYPELLDHVEKIQELLDRFDINSEMDGNEDDNSDEGSGANSVVD